MLGAGEQQAAVHTGGEVAHEGSLVRSGHHQLVVFHVRYRRLGGIDRVGDRVVEVTLDEYIHAVVERGREQQALAVLGCLVHEALYRREEAEVSHVVGLVEHGDEHLVEAALALLDEVLEATGAGHHDVHTAAECLDLRGGAHTAVDDRDVQSERSGERDEGLGHLGRKLTGGHEDEATRALRLAIGAACGDGHDGRHGEGDGLATAGTATADDVPACERIGKRCGLNGECRGDATAVEGLHDTLGNTELVERNDVIAHCGRGRAKCIKGGGQRGGFPLCM